MTEVVSILMAKSPSETPSSGRIGTAVTVVAVAATSVFVGNMIGNPFNRDQERLNETIRNLDDITVTQDGQILGTTTIDTERGVSTGFQTKVILNSQNELAEVHMTVSRHPKGPDLAMPTELFGGPASIIASHERPDGTYITVAQSPEMEGQIGDLLDINVAGLTEQDLRFVDDPSAWPEVPWITKSLVPIQPSNRDAGRIVTPPEL